MGLDHTLQTPTDARRFPPLSPSFLFISPLPPATNNRPAFVGVTFYAQIEMTVSPAVAATLFRAADGSEGAVPGAPQVRVLGRRPAVAWGAVTVL